MKTLYFTALLLTILVPLSASGGAQHWSQQQIDQIFTLLYSEGAASAATEVETSNVTVFDFGIDLIESGETTKAHAWFSAQSLAYPGETSFLLGKAWAEMELNNLLQAMQTANSLLANEADQLTIARAHYLLGVIHKKAGSFVYATEELNEAERLYFSLNKFGGVQLCRNAKGETSNKTIVPGGNPPRDGEDS